MVFVLPLRNIPFPLLRFWCLSPVWQLQQVLICSTCLWLLTGNAVGAITEKVVNSVTPSVTTCDPDALATDCESQSVEVRSQLSPELEIPPELKNFLIAAPENFNPGLRLPPPPPPTPPPTPPAAPPQQVPSPSTDRQTPVVELDNLQVNFRSDEDNLGQRNQFIEPTVQFRLDNGNRILFTTGLNSFNQSGIESITNIPLQLGWEGELGQVRLRAAAGVDFYDRLPTTPNLDLRADIPILPNVTLSPVLEQGSYKFNARTLDNQITAWRYGPDLYWEINSNTSFFSSLRFGNYNDGNVEQQSFSRLEHRSGQFTIAANLFNWSYEQDREPESGYFSPPDFLVYNGEVAWEGDVFDFLRCRLTATFGQQRLLGQTTNATSYQTRCTVRISPNVETDFGYAFSDVLNRSAGQDDYTGSSLTGQLRITF